MARKCQTIKKTMAMLEPNVTICPETITEIIRFEFLRCKNYVTAPEINAPRTPNSPDIAVRKSLKSPTRLGGRFGPEKKYLAPPPPPPKKFRNSPQTPSRRHPLLEIPPPSWDFQQKRSPPPPGASDSPFPLPERKKKLKISETSTKKNYGTQTLAWPCLQILVVKKYLILCGNSR